VQADDLPFAIDLLPHIGFERPDGADFTIGRASPIVDEGRRDGNLFSGHHLNEKVGHIIHFDAAGCITASDRSKSQN